MNEIFYDIKEHGFRQIRELRHNGVLVSKPCEYHNDAGTTVIEMVISGHYVDKNFVDPTPLDEFEFAKMCPNTRTYKVTESQLV